MKPFAPALFLALLLAGLNLPALGQEDVQEKLQQLERNLDDLRQQIDQLRNRMVSDTSEENSRRLQELEDYAIQIHDVLTQLQGQVDTNSVKVAQINKIQEKQLQHQIGIYGTLLAGKVSGEKSLIDAQSFEFILSGQPHQRLSYFAELEFERAATVGGERGGEVLLEQAYTDFTLNPLMNFRGGVLLMPFGNIERDHYAPLRDVISKPLTSYALAPSDWTDNGLGLNGKFNITENWMTDYQAYVVAGLDDNISSTGLRDARQGFGVDNNNNKALVGKLNLQHLSGNSVGLSLYRGAWDENDDHFINGINVDFDFKWRAIEVVGEYTNMAVDRSSSGIAYMNGYYIRPIFTISDFFPKNWLGDDFPQARLELVGQYDSVNIENFSETALPDNWQKRYVIGLNFKPMESWILKTNYENSHAGGPDTIYKGNYTAWLFSLGYVF